MNSTPILAQIPLLPVIGAILLLILAPIILQIINYSLHPERRPSVRKELKKAQRENPPQ